MTPKEAIVYIVDKGVPRAHLIRSLTDQGFFGFVADIAPMSEQEASAEIDKLIEYGTLAQGPHAGGEDFIVVTEFMPRTASALRTQGRTMKRPDWNNYFLNMLAPIAARATCERRQIGALITLDNEIISTGYNGPPKGLKHCGELGGCLRDKAGIESGTEQQVCRAVHAEQNAILQAAFHGRKIRGGTLYTSTSPCVICAKFIINAGITEVIYLEGYPDELSMEMLGEASIQVAQAMLDGDAYVLHPWG